MKLKALFVSSLLLVGLAQACGEPEKDDTSPPTETSETGDTTGSGWLDDAHQGWRDPLCWDCHDTKTTHNSDKAPYECVACHGTNGASAAHTTQTPCSGCHSSAHGGGDDFPDPDSCQTCHI